MKLVELLARELEEWPEGAGWASQDSDKEIRFYEPRFDFYAKDLADDAGPFCGDGAIVTRDEWEAERAKSAPWFTSEPACCHCIEMDVEFPTVSIGVGAACSPEWDGKGLPPVGTVCEAWHNGSAQGVVEVRYAGDCMVLWNVKLGWEQCSAAKNYSFRPIRTEEQIAAQERERALDDIYRIIRTVERPGNKSDMAEALYAAGYRKQEQSE